MGDRSCVLRCRGQLYKITQIYQRVSERSFSRTGRNFLSCLRSSLTNNFARIVADFLHAFASFVRSLTSRHPLFHVLASRPNAPDSACKTANIDVMNFQSAPNRRSLWPDPSDGIPNERSTWHFARNNTFWELLQNQSMWLSVHNLFYRKYPFTIFSTVPCAY